MRALCLTVLLLVFAAPTAWADPAAVSPTAAAPAPPVVAAPPAAAPERPVAHLNAAEALATAQAQGAVRSPREALFKAAVWPGLLWHGAGSNYVGNTDLALGLTGMEGFSLFVSGFALYEVLYVPAKDGENKDTAVALSWAGGALFATSWVWDMVAAPLSARAKSLAPNVSLAPLPGGAQVSVRF